MVVIIVKILPEMSPFALLVQLIYKEDSFRVREKYMLVAIIDTGIQPGVFATGPIVYDLEVTRFGIVRKRRGMIHSFHGAFVAAILEKYAPGCSICSIKIFDDDTQTTTCKMLCAALRWCRHLKASIISISAGSVEETDFERIGRAIDALKENRITVIAAYNKNDLPTMPAGHEAVIGVRTNQSLREGEYIFDHTAIKQDYIASSQHQLCFLSGDTLISPMSTSFAVPTITAALINKEIKDKSRQE